MLCPALALSMVLAAEHLGYQASVRAEGRTRPGYPGDGAVFASKAHKNPTLTIMALAMRSADHIASRLRKGEL